MENSEVLKQARTLWLANFSIALSPFFFTVLILEFAKYEKVREMLIVKLSDYQPAFLAALLGMIVMLIIQGYKFYSNVSAFTAEGSSLSRDAVFSKAASLKKQLGYFLKIAKLGLLVSIPVYLSGLNYIYAILLAAPSIMAYIACSKVYYLRLAPSS